MRQKRVTPRLDFAADDAVTGFRLAHFEFYNWGTYDGAVYTLEMEKQNALLTGDIGSGKSTIVDALTTLLVPHNRIVYNKAAGAESKERSLYSYIVGEYKSVKDELFGSAKAASLRDPAETFTVLLARFENEGFDESITLAQFFYISNKQVQKFFVTSLAPLSIRKDFFDFKDLRELKKRLRGKEHTFVYDSFKEYSRYFRRVMGIKNEQALNLFYQTVSLKSIGNLTSFIRSHMLEPATEIDAQVNEVCHNFSELNRAHNLILEAQRQIEMLTPIDRETERYEKNRQERIRLDEIRGRLGAYMARHKVRLLDEKIAQITLEEEKTQSKKALAEQESRRLYDAILNIDRELQQNGAHRLAYIDSEMERISKEMQERQERKARYDSLSKRLSLPTVSSEHRFLKNREEAQKSLKKLKEQSSALENEEVMNAVVLRQTEEAIEKAQNEIAYLETRRSNIPSRTAQIRDRMAQSLGIERDALPFAGELMRVTDARWEGAIERVLHPLALSLLVDVDDYEAVSDYVERTDLKGKLVYLKVERTQKSGLYDEVASDSLLRKVEIKADSPFAAALEGLLHERYDLPCVESMEAFRRNKRALSIHGQFKTSLMRHEKNDRYDLNDRSRWVLGWENEQKLELLRREGETLHQKRKALQHQIGELRKSKEELLRQRDDLRDLLAFESYAQIDWYLPSRQLESLKEEKRELEESSDIISQLRQKLQEYERRKEENMRTLSALEKQLGRLEMDKQTRVSEREEALGISRETKDLERYEEALSSYLAMHTAGRLNLANIASSESEIRKNITAQIDALDKKIGRSREKIVGYMKEFNNAFPVVAKEFDATVESAEEYRKKLNALKRDNLPKWRRRFKLLLKEKMVQHILVLQNKLDFQSEEIKNKIEAINQSLRDIEYNEGTYIELIAEPVKSIQIREFKEKLKSAVSGAIGEDHSYDEQKFLQIKEIIERFNGREGYSDEDKKWRKAVTDVRNWFDFSAVERYIGDGSEKEYYTDSGGKSGGQKEKLAYTVLASSLAFQFGLEHRRIKSRSFRFVMIDEAFGRGSDESTRYGLRLFEKLNLQLLVITPKQKIHVIEPFVRSVHFVHNRDGMESSLISMQIEEFRKKRDEMQKWNKKENDG